MFLVNPFILGGAPYEQLIDLCTAAGAEALYDPDNPDTWTLRESGGDSFYVNYSDAQGNRTDVAQATESRQGLQVTLSTGRRAMETNFDQWLTADFSPDLPQPFTLLYLSRQHATDGIARMDTLDLGGRVIHGAGSSNWQMFAGSGIDTSTPARDTLWHIWHAVFNGANSENFQDGVSISSGDAGSNALGGVALSENANTRSLTWGPFLVFAGVKTVAELSGFYDHFNANWPIGESA